MVDRHVLFDAETDDALADRSRTPSPSRRGSGDSPSARSSARRCAGRKRPENDETHRAHRRGGFSGNPRDRRRAITSPVPTDPCILRLEPFTGTDDNGNGRDRSRSDRVFDREEDGGHAELALQGRRRRCARPASRSRGGRRRSAWTPSSGARYGRSSSGSPVMKQSRPSRRRPVHLAPGGAGDRADAADGPVAAARTRAASSRVRARAGRPAASTSSGAGSAPWRPMRRPRYSPNGSCCSMPSTAIEPALLPSAGWASSGRWYAASVRSCRNSVSRRRRLERPDPTRARAVPEQAVVHDQQLRARRARALEHVQRAETASATRSHLVGAEDLQAVGAVVAVLRRLERPSS